MNTSVGWVLLGVGAVLVVVGAIPLLWRIGISRLEAISALLFGAGMLLHGVSRLYTLDGGLMPWLATGCTLAGAVLLWRSNRRPASGSDGPVDA